MASVAVRCGGRRVACSVGQGWKNLRAPSNRNAALTMISGGGMKEMMTPISISSASSSSSMAICTNRLETKRKQKNTRRGRVARERDSPVDERLRRRDSQ
ncbi:hypothetical protein ACOSQ2_017714 [Xanthoceras sorbifolium]